MPTNIVPLIGGAISAGASSISLGDVIFSNANGVSFGLNGSTVTASVVGGGGAGGTISASGSSVELGQVVFSNSNNVSFGMDGSTITGSASYAAQTQFVLSNSNGISFGTDGSTVTASYSVPLVTNSSATISAGASSQTLGSLIFSNSNGLSFGLSAGTITGTVKTDYQSSGNYLTTAMASNAGSNFVNTSAGVNLTNISATFNSNSISLSVGAYITTARASNDAIGLNTAKTNVTWTVNSSGLSLDAGGYAGTNTAITGGSVTLNTSGISINLPAYLTTAMASNASTQFVQANASFNGTNATGTIASNGISISVNATVAQSNQSMGIYASSNTYLTSSGTVDARSMSFRGDKSITVGISSGEVVFSVGAYLTTARASNDAVGLNTALTGNGVAWTVNSSGLSLNIPAFLTTARGSTDAIGLNTALTGNGVAWTVNSSGLSLNVPAFLTTAMQSASSSVFAKTGFTSATTAGTVIVATHDTAGLSMGVPAYLTTAAQNISISMWPDMPEQMLQTATIYSGSATATNGTNTTVSALVFPMAIQQNVAFNNLRVWASNSIVTSIASSLTYMQGISFGLYTLNGNNLSLASSFTNTMQYVQSTSNNSGNSSVGITMGWGNSSTTFQTGNSSNFSSLAVSISGAKMYPLNWTSAGQTLTPGQYFGVLMFSHSTRNSAAGTLQSIGVVSKSYSLPPEAMKATGSTTAGWPFLGVVSLVLSTNSLLPPSIATANLTTATNSASNFNSSGWVQMFTQ